MMADGYTPDFVEIYHEFLEQTPSLLEALDAYLAAGDLAKTCELAHKIKGSSANFGFVGVTTPLVQLESTARDTGTLTGGSALVQAARRNFLTIREEVHAQRGI